LIHISRICIKKGELEGAIKCYIPIIAIKSGSISIRRTNAPEDKNCNAAVVAGWMLAHRFASFSLPLYDTLR